MEKVNVRKHWIDNMVCAVVSGGILIATTFGQDNTSPQYLGSPLNCLYGWLKLKAAGYPQINNNKHICLI